MGIPSAPRRALAAATAALVFVGFGVGSASASQASATPGKERVGQAPAQGQPTRSGYADVAGGRIHFQVYGDLASGKTPLLVLHGSFMSGDSMWPIIEPFTANRPVVAIDACGHGRTGDLPGPITHELMADDAAAVLAALNVRHADVLGYSMGGTTALFMAIRHPDRVGKQIILSAPSRLDGWYPEVVEGMAKVTPEVFAGTVIEAEHKRLSPASDKFSTYVEEVIGLEKVRYAASDDAIRAIGGKTMIIVGDADGMTLEHAVELFKLRGGGDREAAAQGFIAGAPRARLAILPATSHIGMMAEAERIAELATPFLDDQGPPRATGFFEGMDKPSDPAADPAKQKSEQE